MVLEFDGPETLYAVHKLAERERRLTWTNGVPSHYALLDHTVLARVEAIGFSTTWHPHRVVRVTSGTVDADAHWRRARHATRDRMRRLYAEETRWHAKRRKQLEGGGGRAATGGSVARGRPRSAPSWLRSSRTWCSSCDTGTGRVTRTGVD